MALRKGFKIFASSTNEPWLSPLFLGLPWHNGAKDVCISIMLHDNLSTLKLDVYYLSFFVCDLLELCSM